MEIAELKMALIEVKKICQHTRNCKGCPFYEFPDFGCRLDIFPHSWFTSECAVCAAMKLVLRVTRTGSLAGKKKTKFCGNCGALMDGGKSDG